MKQQHINLLRAAANLLQSSQIQDENIAELKREMQKELHKKNIARVDVLKNMIEFAKKRNKQFLTQYADAIQQLTENDFTRLLSELLDEEELSENPVFNRLQKAFA